MTAETEPKPSAITWSQLSIGTKMAIGAREPSSTDEGRTLRIRVGGAAKRYITVTLEWTDTYTVKLIGPPLKADGPDAWCHVYEESSDIYVDQLNDVVYRMVNK
jgi:hypothetical protein